jgi:putative FmdB family regulatory protein
MPTYVYACSSCGKQFEQFQSFKDEPLRTCLCGQEGTLRRVFQPVGIVFKGSGWYITDSRKSETASVSGKGETASTGDAAKAEAGDGKSDSKPETKADSKPETKAESKPETKSESSIPAS